MRCAPPGQRVQCAACFVRKSRTLPTAAQYLASGHYLWNSGMFCLSVGTLLAELEQHAPEVLRSIRLCIEKSPVQHGSAATLQELDAASFSNVPDISIDYAVMEHSRRAAVIPATFDWSDIVYLTRAAATRNRRQRGQPRAG